MVLLRNTDSFTDIKQNYQNKKTDKHWVVRDRDKRQTERARRKKTFKKRQNRDRKKGQRPRQNKYTQPV